MIVGAAIVELMVHDSRSLKRKRGVVRSVIQRVRNRFNLSVAEVGGQGTWQLAVIGLACTGTDAVGVRRQLDRALEFIEELHLAEVLGSDVEITDLPYEGMGQPGDPGIEEGSEVLAGEDGDPWEPET
ncbi:DUF503 domain-containing protein [Myxococcota bacterium]|nr:DUF503 domain-containing protein [Myxococcota bacterium]